MSLELQLSGCKNQVKQAGERIAELEEQLSGYRQQLTATQYQLEQTTAQLQEKKVSHWRWYIGPDCAKTLTCVTQQFLSLLVLELHTPQDGHVSKALTKLRRQQ